MSNGHSLARRVVLLLAAAVAVVVVVYTSVVVRAPEPSQAPAWQDPQTGMEFVLVREGTYQMGTPPHEPDREAQEVPHSVRLSRPFYLGRYEVTQAEWTRVMGQNPSFFNECARCP
ncbi:MAG TPA: SUMF1/EgtB/PvdO family nonheme iron enzyme, partial [Vicinamibacterales bacterium]|nr:SUMF1/EgtB/PvdO family nonheme iron enzyme [Vicinamibacterales bacterium]